MGLQSKFTQKERKFLDSLHVDYKDIDKDPDLLLDKRNGHLSLAPWHTTTFGNFVKMVEANSYEETNFMVEISYDDGDDSAFTSTMTRHFRQVNMEIRVSEVLDEWGVLALLDMYLKDELFRVGKCGIMESLMYEREQRESS